MPEMSTQATGGCVRGRNLGCLLVGGVSKALGDVGSDHFDGDAVVASLGDNDVGVALGGLNELEVHGADSVIVLFDDGLDGAAAVSNVAFHASDEANVVVGVDEDLDIEELEKLRLSKDEDSLDDDDLARLLGDGFLGSAVRFEIVDGHLCGLVVLQLVQVLDQQLCLQ